MSWSEPTRPTPSITRSTHRLPLSRSRRTTGHAEKGALGPPFLFVKSVDCGLFATLRRLSLVRRLIDQGGIQVTRDGTEVQYLVLGDRTDPYLLARVRWPDIAQAISAGCPDWQDDLG